MSLVVLAIRLALFFIVTHTHTHTQKTTNSLLLFVDSVIDIPDQIVTANVGVDGKLEGFFLVTCPTVNLSHMV